MRRKCGLSNACEYDAMDGKITHDDIDRQFYQLRKDPERFLELTNQLVEQHPDDANAYFARHQAWQCLGMSNFALADLDRSLALEDHYVTHRARGRVLRELGRYQDAIDAYDRSEQLDPEQWIGGFGPLFRADCHARLGDEPAALADCDTMPDDHWTPGFFGLPPGNKQEVADELRRRAAAARNAR
jgi:tetratricopeptide (TPR) repeat protein